MASYEWRTFVAVESVHIERGFPRVRLWQLESVVALVELWRVVVHVGDIPEQRLIEQKLIDKIRKTLLLFSWRRIDAFTRRIEYN